MHTHTDSSKVAEKVVGKNKRINRRKERYKRLDNSDDTISIHIGMKL